MTRNKTSLLCVRAYKNRANRKEASIPSSEQMMKAGFMVMTREQSSSLPSGRFILLPSKRVEADEVRPQDHVFCFLEQWSSSSEGVFLQCQPVNQQFCIGVLRVFMEAAGRNCPTSGVHRTGCCIMTTHHAKWIHSIFWCLTKKKMVVVSDLSTSPSQSSWLILVHKNRNIVKGMKIQDKAQSQAALEHITK